jgi:hypothetical protein
MQLDTPSLCALLRSCERDIARFHDLADRSAFLAFGLTDLERERDELLAAIAIREGSL